MSGLPDGWATATLEELSGVGGLVSDGDWIESKDQDPDGEVRLIQLMDVGDGDFRDRSRRFVNVETAERLNCTRLKKDDVLIARMPDPLGRACVFPGVGQEAITAVDVLIWRGGDYSADPRWLRGAINSPGVRAAMIEQAGGTTRQRIAGGRLKSLELPVPPLAEQRRIVAKLEALTARTARARADLDRIPSLVARYKLSLLRKAVRGELTQAWRQQARPEPTADLLQRTPPPQQGRGGREATTEVVPGQAALSVNDPGTPAPDGWAWTPLLRLARQETGHTPSRGVAGYWGGEVPWIGIRDAGAHHGRTISDTLQTITDEGLANSSARLLPAGTVCLSRTASVGYVTIMARPMATSQDFATWTCSEALVPEFLMYALMAEGDDIRTFGEGSTHTTIYFPAIRALHICLPSPEEQHEIVGRVKAGLAEIDRLAAEAAAARQLLDRLDQAILAKAFQGDLVPQDPADEPASVLLERIRADRAAAPKPKRGQRAAA